MSVSEKLVRARKRHWCEEYGAPHHIEPGQDYVRAVAFPDGDINTGDQPWVMKICVTHYEAGGVRTAPTRVTPPGMPSPQNRPLSERECGNGQGHRGGAERPGEGNLGANGGGSA